MNDIIQLPQFTCKYSVILTAQRDVGYIILPPQRHTEMYFPWIAGTTSYIRQHVTYTSVQKGKPTHVHIYFVMPVAQCVFQILPPHSIFHTYRCTHIETVHVCALVYIRVSMMNYMYIATCTCIYIEKATCLESIVMLTGGTISYTFQWFHPTCVY